MTSTASEAASYEFTTLTCIPGVIEVSWGSLGPGREGELVCGKGLHGGDSWLSCPGLKHEHLWGLGLPGPQRRLAHPAVQAGSKDLPV